MTKKKIDRKPSFVHHGKGKKEILVGEFHYGSASDSKVLEKGKGVTTFLTDPPYNLGFDYGPEVNDKQSEEDYHQMMEDIFDSCYDAAADDANLFIIHYPQDLAKMWPRLTLLSFFSMDYMGLSKNNFGQSSKKFIFESSRTILWLVKLENLFFME